jgi:hypothetical protein
VLAAELEQALVEEHLAHGRESFSVLHGMGPKWNGRETVFTTRHKKKPKAIFLFSLRVA